MILFILKKNQCVFSASTESRVIKHLLRSILSVASAPKVPNATRFFQRKTVSLCYKFYNTRGADVVALILKGNGRDNFNGLASRLVRPKPVYEIWVWKAYRHFKIFAVLCRLHTNLSYIPNSDKKQSITESDVIFCPIVLNSNPTYRNL